MARKRHQPQLRRLDLTATLNNPALHEVEAEHSDPATWSETWQVLIIAGAGAFCGWLMASGAAWVFGLAGNALQMVTAGSVGLVLLVVCQSQTSNARRVRQRATFDRQPGDTVKAPDFVGVSDSPRTLVRDFKLRSKVERWAGLLQSDGYRLAYPLWTGKGKVFSRGEYDLVRAALRALSYEADDQLTPRGRSAVGRWAVGSFQAREVHEFRTPPPAGQTDVRDD